MKTADYKAAAERLQDYNTVFQYYLKGMHYPTFKLSDYNVKTYLNLTFRLNEIFTPESQPKTQSTFPIPF